MGNRKEFIVVILGVCFIGVIGPFTARWNGAMAQDNPFSIPAVESQTVFGERLESSSEQPIEVLCFLGVDCPIARFYALRLQSLDHEYRQRGVQIIGIFSNLQDSEEDIRGFGKQHGLSFPLIKDWDQNWARRMKARRTAEVIVLDTRRQVRYRGRIDDQYEPGTKRSKASNRELEEALDALLSGRDLIQTDTEPVGCLITFDKAIDTKSEVTYCKTIAPILQNHCLECHRPGEIGPFSISDYDEVRGWSEMILEVVENHRMPPWHAASGHLPLKNARSFPAENVEAIRKWIQAGMPYGSPADLPPVPTFLDGWRLPKDPDLVVAMRDRPFTIPAEGSVEYQYFVVDPKIDEDRWVTAAQVVPGNAAVVHHAIVFIRPPDGEDFRGIGWLTAYVPGQRATEFPPGHARRIPAGSKLVFQMHYTPTGQIQEDNTRIGINFVDESKVTHEVITTIGIDQDFEIPPRTSNFEVRAKAMQIPKRGSLLAVMPHMHLRGKSFRLFQQHGEQRSIVLDVPKYDFNWQHTYEFAEPISLAEVDGLDFVASFDNSVENPFNPNPEEFVMWGDQTWEEMAVAFFEVAVPREPQPEPPLAGVDSPAVASTIKAQSANVVSDNTDSPTKSELDFADDFMRRFDRNQDGSVLFEEASRIVRDYSFWRFDQDRDHRVTRDELLAVLRNRRGQ